MEQGGERAYHSHIGTQRSQCHSLGPHCKNLSLVSVDISSISFVSGLKQSSTHKA